MLGEPTSSAVKTVPDKSERGRSTIEWPYFSLDDATKLAKGIFELGGVCTNDQLAGHLNQTASGGAFRLKVQAARTFNLIRSSQGKLSLSELGHQLMEPESAASARVEAFLTVPLYRAIYETYKGKTLPPTGGLESAFVNLGVAPKQKEKARQAFQRSARDAGFFAYGSTKLVIPVLPVAVGHGKAQAESEESVVPQTGEIGGGGNGGGDDTHHPLIDGLIRALPEAGKPWTLEARRKWLQAAAMNFDYVYADTETGNRSIRVSVITDKDSAN